MDLAALSSLQVPPPSTSEIELPVVQEVVTPVAVDDSEIAVHPNENLESSEQDNALSKEKVIVDENSITEVAKVEKNEVAKEKSDSTVAVAVAVAGDLLPVQAEVASIPPPEREKVVSADITSVQADQTSVPQGGGEVAPRVVKQVGSTKPYPLIYSRRNKGGRAGLVVPEKSTVVPAGLAGEKSVEEGQMAVSVAEKPVKEGQLSVHVAEKPVKEGQLSVLGPEKPVPRFTYSRRKKTSDVHLAEKSVKEGQLSVLGPEKPVPRFTYSRREKQPSNQDADVSQAMDGHASGVGDLLTRKPFLSDEPIDEPVEERQFEKSESYRSAETRKITPAAQAPETASGQEPEEK